jgi:transcriptional regulator with XRE-family HTH domain
MKKSNYILDNINEAIKAKKIKLEFIAHKLGISQGEVSKILNGDRKEYEKYIYDFSKILDIDYQELVCNHGVKLINDGDVKEQSQGVLHNLNHGEKELYNERILDLKEINRMNKENISDLTAQMEYWKNKYYKLKDKTYGGS